MKVALYVLCCALAACLSIAAQSENAAYADNSDNPTITVYDDRWAPATMQVPPLVAVTWVNAGQNSHVVRSDNNAWQTFRLQPGAQHSVTFRSTGEFPYKVDGTIKGLIVVVAALTSAPPSTTQPGVFRYHVVTDGARHTRIRHPDGAGPGYTQPYEFDGNETFRSDYPEVDIQVLEYQGAFLILEKDRWHTSGYQAKPTDPQGTITVKFTGKQPYCDVKADFKVPAWITIYSRNQESPPDRFHFHQDDFEYVFGTPVQDHMNAAVKTGCRPHPGVGPDRFGYVGFPLEIGREEITTSDGLTWARGTNRTEYIDVYRRDGPPLVFPVNMLKEGKSFTFTTGKLVADFNDQKVCQPSCARIHAEEVITIKFTRK